MPLITKKDRLQAINRAAVDWSNAHRPNGRIDRAPAARAARGQAKNIGTFAGSAD